MARVACYVDGFNLYHAIDELERNDIKWLDLRTLAETFLQPGDELLRVTYFTALLNWNKEKRQRHVHYLRALRYRGVEVVESYFQRVDRRCRRSGNRCPFDSEKQTDVAIAIRVYTDSRSLDRSHGRR
jgi:hypothetical protein